MITVISIAAGVVALGVVTIALVVFFVSDAHRDARELLEDEEIKDIERR